MKKKKIKIKFSYLQRNSKLPVIYSTQNSVKMVTRLFVIIYKKSLEYE